MTLEEIKNNIIKSNPSREYVINGETFVQTDEEYNAAIDARAQMEYEQFLYRIEKEQIETAKASAFKKLGLTEEEITILLKHTQEILPKADA